MAEPTEIEHFDGLLSRRHSCRAFLPDAIPDAVIGQIFTTAQKVPSWCNAQPWQVIVTRGAATDAFRAAMIAAAENAPHRSDIPFPERYDGIYKARRSACGWALYDTVGVARGDRAGSAREMRRNFMLFGAPHVAIITAPRDLGTYGVLDCGAFVTAFTLAAEALGVASIPQAALAGYCDVVRAHFAIPHDRVIVCGISFGRRDAAHAANGFRTGRAPSGQVVEWR